MPGSVYKALYDVDEILNIQENPEAEKDYKFTNYNWMHRLRVLKKKTISLITDFKSLVRAN